MKEVKVGDTVIRMIATLEVPLRVTAVDEELIHCGGWTFERESGVEYDEMLHWGSRWGVSGSYLKDWG